MSVLVIFFIRLIGASAFAGVILFAALRMQSQAKSEGAAAGYAKAIDQCQQAAQAGRAQADGVAAEDTRRARAVGRGYEQRHSHIDAVFKTLDNEALNDSKTSTSRTAIDSVACVLSHDRLLRWQAANRGDARDARADAAPAQSFDAASAAAAASQWGDGGLGIKPQGGGEGLSPARGAYVRHFSFFERDRQ